MKSTLLCFKVMQNRLFKLMRNIAAFLLLMGCPLGTFAQISLLDFPSPNAAGLGQFGQVPVSLFNGLAQISIPLHEIRYADISIPVSLSYHGGGIRTDDYPGWVGLGWSLQAGGSIIRIVNGMPDEICSADLNEGLMGAQYSPNVEYGYFYRSRDLDNANWITKPYLFEYISSGGGSGTLKAWDAEPDEFIFNAGDLSGSFYMYRDANGSLKVKVKSKSGEHIKVEPVMTTTSNPAPFSYSLEFDIFKGITTEEAISQPKAKIRRTFLSFTLTRANGMKYVFGGDYKSIECNTTPRGTNTVRTLAVAWNLTSIQSQKGQISFEYKKEGDVFVKRKARNRTCIQVGSGVGCSTPDEPASYISYSLQHPSYLTKITSDRGVEMDLYSSPVKQLQFDFTDNHHQEPFSGLASDQTFHQEFLQGSKWSNLIYIKLGGGRVIYFNYKYDPFGQERLKLEGVEFRDENWTVNNKYKFGYNQQFLPIYNSQLSDNWGYYNNKYHGGQAYSALYAYRSPDINCMKAELLEKIIYPTGGSTLFEYEAHTYSQIAEQFPAFTLTAQEGTAGGLRIKKITTKTSRLDNNPVIKEYSYVQANGSSSGILSGIPVYYTTGRHLVDVEYNYWDWFVHFSGGAHYEEYYHNYSESPLNPLGNTNGNHVTYSRVVEKQAGNGYTVYEYTNHQDFPDQMPIIIYGVILGQVISPQFTSLEIERGLIKSEKTYNVSDLLVRETAFHYNSSASRYDDFVKTINQVNYSGLDQDMWQVAPNKVYTFWPYLESRETKEYDLDGLITNTTSQSYTYTAENLLRTETTVNSRGETVSKQYSYPGNMLSSDPTGIYTEMYGQHIYSPVIETLANLANGKYEKQKVEYYRPFTGIYVPQTISESNSLRSSWLTRFRNENYDLQGNVLVQAQNNGSKTIYVWAYNGQYPVFAIKNATYPAVVALLGGSTAVTSLRTSNPTNASLATLYNTLKIGLPNAFVTGFTYDPFIGLTSQIDAKGVKTFYEYDAFQRLGHVRDQELNYLKSYEYNYKP